MKIEFPVRLDDPNAAHDRDRQRRGKDGYRPLSVVDRTGQLLFQVGDTRHALELAEFVVDAMNTHGMKQNL